MGQDKALLPFRGRPMIAHVAELLEPFVDEIVVVGRGREDLGFLGLRMLDDAPDLAGPLAGLAAGLSAAAQSAGDRHGAALLVPCDVPNLGPDRLANLVAAWTLEPAAPAVVYAVPGEWPAGGDRPLPGIYSQAALPALYEEAERGRGSLRGLLARLSGVRRILVSEDALSATRGVNTPEEYQALLALGREPSL